MAWMTDRVQRIRTDFGAAEVAASCLNVNLAEDEKRAQQGRELCGICSASHQVSQTRPAHALASFGPKDTRWA